MKIKILFSAFVFTALAFVNSAPAQTTRINFKRGAASATATGTLQNYRGKKVFVVRLRRGQTLRTEQIGNDNSLNYITVYVKSPGGEYVGDSDASCNSRREISPTVAGNYRIEVVECRKADAWRGRFKLKISAR